MKGGLYEKDGKESNERPYTRLLGKDGTGTSDHTDKAEHDAKSSSGWDDSTGHSSVGGSSTSASASPRICQLAVDTYHDDWEGERTWQTKHH